MRPEELLAAMLELARELELEIRAVGSTPVPGSDGPPSSGVCRVRGKVWVLLSTADLLPQQIDAIGRGLIAHAGEALEDRYLAPALRERLAAIRGESGQD